MDIIFFLMMKPCQAPLNKAPNKGERKNKERRPKSQPELQNPKWVTKRQRNELCFKTLANHKNHFKKGKGNMKDE
jgi:hypothetical protein